MNIIRFSQKALAGLAFSAVIFSFVSTGYCAAKSARARGVANTNATASIPFQLTLTEVPNSTLPGLHSFSSASHSGKWLLIGGRTAGLHGFGNGTNNFPRSTANTNIYVVDPAANRVLGTTNLMAALAKYPEIAGPLTASNPEFVQVGTHLYVVGGYGKDLTTGTMTTFGTLIEIDVPGLITAVTTKSPIIVGKHIRKTPGSDNRLKVTGGSLKHANGIFYLIFGQDFTGDYSIRDRDYNRAGGQFQKYNEFVRAFTLMKTTNGIAIGTYNQFQGPYDPNLPYHRRDLNVVDTIQSDGQTLGATVYGGVFKAGQIAGHVNPIDLTLTTNATNAIYTSTNPPVLLQSGFKQALSQYDCANLNVYDPASTSTFTTLFGGISQFHYSFPSNVLIWDTVDLSKGVDGLPFVNTVTTIRHSAPGTSFAQFIQPATLPALLGTDAQVLLNGTPGKGSLFANGVVNLGQIKGQTLVGYLYGGIQSYGPYSGLVTNNPSTIASGRLFQIYITPGNGAVIPMPALPPQPVPYVGGLAHP